MGYINYVAARSRIANCQWVDRITGKTPPAPRSFVSSVADDGSVNSQDFGAESSRSDSQPPRMILLSRRSTRTANWVESIAGKAPPAPRSFFSCVTDDGSVSSQDSDAERSDPQPPRIILLARRSARTANWVESIAGKTLPAPRSFFSDADDGLSSQDSDTDSESYSESPRMISRYFDGRPDVALPWLRLPESQEPLSTSSHHHASRPPPGFHGHHQSNPDMHVPSNVVPSHVTVIPPETTPWHIHPLPTGPLFIHQQSPPDAYSPDPSALTRSRSNRSSRRPQESLQIYSPPSPAPPSSQSHSAPVSFTGEDFQLTQPPPPLPHPSTIIVPSPIVFPFPTSPPAPPQAAPPTDSSKTHSRTHPYSSNHSYPHPPPQPSSNPRLPPTLYHSGSTVQHHSSRAGFSSHIGPHPQPPSQFPHVGSQQSGFHTDSGISPSRRHGHGPLSIVYALSSFHGDDSHMIGGSSSSLVTIGPPANRDNPQIRPYSSSTDLHSNGSTCDASFTTSPSLCLTQRS
jgi:hypothetical protein